MVIVKELKSLPLWRCRVFKVDRALKEVWDWKEQIYQETKSVGVEKQIALICEQAKKSCKGLRLKKFSPQFHTAATR